MLSHLIKVVVLFLYVRDLYLKERILRYTQENFSAPKIKLRLERKYKTVHFDPKIQTFSITNMKMSPENIH
jgi:hypothetical protein